MRNMNLIQPIITIKYQVSMMIWIQNNILFPSIEIIKKYQEIDGLAKTRCFLLYFVKAVQIRKQRVFALPSISCHFFNNV